MTSRPAPGTGAFGIMVLLCAIWGLQQVAIKLAGQGVTPLFQVGVRSAIAAALVFLRMCLRGQPLLTRDASLRPGLLAGGLFALEFICIFVGLEYTGASRMVVFLYTAPCFTVLGLHWFVPGERLRWRQGSGILLAFAGIAIAFGDAQGGTARHWIGDVLGVLAAIFWAATIVVIRASALTRVSAAKVLLYQLVVSAVVALPLAALAGEVGLKGGWDALTLPVVLALLYLSVVVAFASYLTWFWLLTRYLASRLMVFSFLTPLFGVAFGVMLLGERMNLGFGIAAVMVVAGIVLVNLPGQRERPPAGGRSTTDTGST